MIWDFGLILPWTIKALRKRQLWDPLSWGWDGVREDGQNSIFGTEQKLALLHKMQTLLQVRQLWGREMELHKTPYNSMPEPAQKRIFYHAGHSQRVLVLTIKMRFDSFTGLFLWESLKNQRLVKCLISSCIFAHKDPTTKTGAVIKIEAIFKCLAFIRFLLYVSHAQLEVLNTAF